MRARRMLALILGAVLVAAAAASSPAAAGPPKRVTLAGVNVVTAARSASMAVWLPRDADVRWFDDLLIRGRGRIIAFALHRDGGCDGLVWNCTAMLVRYGECPLRACTPAHRGDRIPVVTPEYVDRPFVGRLSAGAYHLHVVTDGAPVTATIRLRGLSGRRSLRPTGPAPGRVGEPTPTQAVPSSQPSLFAAGSHHVVPAAGGLQAGHLWKEFPTWPNASETSSCWYQGPPPAGPTPAFQKPCSAAGFLTGSHEHESMTPVGPGRWVGGLEFVNLLPPADLSLGGYSNTAGPVTSAHYQELWLDFAA
jgi:hypothetical protein